MSVLSDKLIKGILFFTVGPCSTYLSRFLQGTRHTWNYHFFFFFADLITSVLFIVSPSVNLFSE